MLEFFCDAHTHLSRFDCNVLPLEDARYCCLTSALSSYEWQDETAVIAQIKDNIAAKDNITAKSNIAANGERVISGRGGCPYVFRAFGIHPLSQEARNASFLYDLLQQNALDAVGEAGFDYRLKGTRCNTGTVERQQSIWRMQLDAAMQYDLPLVVHCVKSLDVMFRYVSLLSRLKAVIFHAFTGSSTDAASFLRHGVNAYFSFGEQIAIHRRAAECAAGIPKDRLLLETDGKGDATAIRRIYQTASAIRLVSAAVLCETVKCNFVRAMQ